MNKNATAQLHVYSAFFVLAGFVLNRGVFLLFLAEKGMSVTEIALYQALFNIATVVLELPTGLIGDCFGKKFSIQMGVLLLFFHTAGMLLLSGPFLVVLSLVEALAYSLQSGSEQALLYEIARNAGQGDICEPESDYHDFYSSNPCYTGNRSHRMSACFQRNCKEYPEQYGRGKTDFGRQSEC